ncbi:hypothetical protein T03_7374 [Trichinella britovi]|uniref:Uncharacterized protein n=1 Tax=Trichinella britovi TaxID=45882 RepID=A0A0V1C7M9_TRIBR|nr:hypothetical protein T03_7374 [Trichinella britovi]
MRPAPLLDAPDSQAFAELNAEGKCALPINDGSFFMVIMHFLYYGVECCKVVILKVGDIAPLGAVGIIPCDSSCICFTMPKTRCTKMEPVESEKTQLEEEPGTLQG